MWWKISLWIKKSRPTIQRIRVRKENFFMIERRGESSFTACLCYAMLSVSMCLQKHWTCFLILFKHEIRFFSWNRLKCTCQLQTNLKNDGIAQYPSSIERAHGYFSYLILPLIQMDRNKCRQCYSFSSYNVFFSDF